MPSGIFAAAGAQIHAVPEGHAMCSTDTPAGFDVTDTRTKLQRWLAAGLAAHQPLNGKPARRASPMTLLHCVQLDDSQCHNRATDWIPGYWDTKKLLMPKVEDDQLVDSASGKFGATIPDRMCCVQYKGGLLKGETTRFEQSFHWVLVIGHGTDTQGTKFLVVLDPDVTATPRSRKKWTACSAGADFAAPPTQAILDEMFLGRNNKLGGLVRYYTG
jgi:hypothetical protein